jgi:spermidine synthase
MITHPVLFTHPEPQRVVIIGGGDCGTLKEVLRHACIEQVTQVEIDRRVTELSEQFFPALCESNHDPRAQILFEDGIQWITQTPEGSIDVIIVDSTDPIGPATGLYNRAFYQQCRRALKPQGLLVQQSESPLLHLALLSSIHREMRAAGFETTRSVQFPQCVYPSGWWTVTMGGVGDLTAFRYADALNKSFPTRYYDADIHKASLVLPSFLSEALYGLS